MEQHVIKPYLMETIGTFFLTLAICLNGNPFSIGLILATMIYIGAHISGAHFNPAISLAMWMRKKLPTIHLACYTIAQIIGAIGALYAAKSIAQSSEFSLNLQYAGPLGLGFAIELLLTCIFVWAMITVTTVRTLKDTPIYGFVIGLALAAVIFVGGPIGALINPAVGAGTILTDCIHAASSNSTGMELGHKIAIYIGGSLLGGALAALAYDYFNAPSNGNRTI